MTRGASRGVVAVALLAAVGRALVFAGTDLYADEAYYWLWGQRLDVGYFDHPPVVAWLSRASSDLLPGEFGVRLLFLACGAATVWLTARIAAELTDDARAPVIAALLAATAPMMTITGALALPDAPQLCLQALATWLVLRASGRTWLLAGVVLGLAMLTKYSSVLIAPGVLAALVFDPSLRGELRTRWPWLGALVALAVFLPCLAWNVSHDFVSLRFQASHAFAGQRFGKYLPDYAGALLAGAGPVAVLLGLGRLVRGRSSAEVRLAGLVLVPLAVTTWSACRGPVEANWPAIAYPGLLAAAAAAITSSPRTRLWTGLSMAFGVGVAGLYVAELRHPRLMAASSPPIERFRGWPEQARSIVRACGGHGMTIVPSNYQVAAALAFYAEQRSFEATYARRSQFDLWPQGIEPRRCLVTLGEPDAATLVSHGFAPDTHVERIDATFAGSRFRPVWVATARALSPPAPSR